MSDGGGASQNYNDGFLSVWLLAFVVVDIVVIVLHITTSRYTRVSTGGSSSDGYECSCTNYTYGYVQWGWKFVLVAIGAYFIYETSSIEIEEVNDNQQLAYSLALAIIGGAVELVIYHGNVTPNYKTRYLVAGLLRVFVIGTIIAMLFHNSLRALCRTEDSQEEIMSIQHHIRQYTQRQASVETNKSRIKIRSKSQEGAARPTGDTEMAKYTGILDSLGDASIRNTVVSLEGTGTNTSCGGEFLRGSVNDADFEEFADDGGELGLGYGYAAPKNDFGIPGFDEHFFTNAPKKQSNRKSKDRPVTKKHRTPRQQSIADGKSVDSSIGIQDHRSDTLRSGTILGGIAMTDTAIREFGASEDVQYQELESSDDVLFEAGDRVVIEGLKSTKYNGLECTIAKRDAGGKYKVVSDTGVKLKLSASKLKRIPVAKEEVRFMRQLTALGYFDGHEKGTQAYTERVSKARKSFAASFPESKDTSQTRGAGQEREADSETGTSTSDAAPTCNLALDAGSWERTNTARTNESRHSMAVLTRSPLTDHTMEFPEL